MRQRARRDGSFVSVLVGNKCDVQDRETSLDQGIIVTDTWQCDFLEASAKTGKNVEEIFAVAVRRLRLAKQKRKLEESESSQKRQKRENKGCVILLCVLYPRALF